jgi:hypothetical protein
VLAIDQQYSVTQQNIADTALMFGLLKVPLNVNSGRLWRLMGLGSALPEAGHCEVVDGSSQPTGALSTLERVELLDVGDLTVIAKGKNQRLSRQAFPTVTDFMSGVIYTTRDNPSDFSIDSSLVLRGRGSTQLPAFNLTANSVEPPRHITLDHIPIDEVTRQSVISSFELRWDKGQKTDYIWLELAATNGRKSLSCVFVDSDGYGVVPGMQLNLTGDGRLVVHRISVQEASISGVDRTEVRFDVRVTQMLQLY